MLRTSHRCCLASDLPCLTGIRPQAEVSCMNFFLLLKLYCFSKANFRSAAPACIIMIVCVNPTNRMRGHDEARRREASVQRSRPEVGRSIYNIYIYLYHDSGDVDLLTEASLRLGPIICEYKFLRFWDSDDFAGINFCDFTKSTLILRFRVTKDTRFCKAKWAEPFNPPPPPLSLSLSLSLSSQA